MIILLGPTGAGKTIQAKILAEEYGMFWLSAGDLLRHTDAPEVKAALRAGELVNEDTVNKIVSDTLDATPLSQTVVMDGFPREMVQAEWLEKKVATLERDIRAVIHIVISDKVAIERLKDRGREDDSEASIKKRLEQMYREHVMPVVKFYEEKGLIREVNGEQSIEAVHEDIKDIITDVVESL